MGPTIRRLFGALLTFAVVGGIGVGVYFGVIALLEADNPTITATAEVIQQAQATETIPAASQETVETNAAGQDVLGAQTAEQTEPEPTPQQASVTSPASDPATPIAVSLIEPAEAAQPVTPTQIGGASIVAERATAEPIPSGIPRRLADGADYDPTEPATVFTSHWPPGTTLRLTRLPGTTLLTDEQQRQVVGSQTLVVVRATESSNTDLQLSPAAFEQIAFYGVERVVAVRVEVTAPPPKGQ